MRHIYYILPCSCTMENWVVKWIYWPHLIVDKWYIHMELWSEYIGPTLKWSSGIFTVWQWSMVVYRPHLAVDKWCIIDLTRECPSNESFHRSEFAMEDLIDFSHQKRLESNKKEFISILAIIYELYWWLWYLCCCFTTHVYD